MSCQQAHGCCSTGRRCPTIASMQRSTRAFVAWWLRRRLCNLQAPADRACWLVPSMEAGGWRQLVPLISVAIPCTKSSHCCSAYQGAAGVRSACVVHLLAPVQTVLRPGSCPCSAFVCSVYLLRGEYLVGRVLQPLAAILVASCSPFHCATLTRLHSVACLRCMYQYLHGIAYCAS